MEKKFMRLERLAPNLRYQRAQMFTAQVMKTLGDLLEPDEQYPKKRRDACDRLFELFHREGFDVITDEDRAMAGLEKRGELGWTDRELQILENTRMLAMLKPIQSVAFPSALDELGKLDGDLLAKEGE